MLLGFCIIFFLDGNFNHQLIAFVLLPFLLITQPDPSSPPSLSVFVRDGERGKSDPIGFILAPAAVNPRQPLTSPIFSVNEYRRKRNGFLYYWHSGLIKTGTDINRQELLSSSSARLFKHVSSSWCTQSHTTYPVSVLISTLFVLLTMKLNPNKARKQTEFRNGAAPYNGIACRRVSVSCVYTNKTWRSL